MKYQNSFYPLQTCTPKQNDCVQKVTTRKSDCLPPCSGLILTSFFKAKWDKVVDEIIPEDLEAYRKFTNWYPFPTALRGTLLCGTLSIIQIRIIIDYNVIIL